MGRPGASIRLETAMDETFARRLIMTSQLSNHLLIFAAWNQNAGRMIGAVNAWSRAVMFPEPVPTLSWTT